MTPFLSPAAANHMAYVMCFKLGGRASNSGSVGKRHSQLTSKRNAKGFSSRVPARSSKLLEL